MAMCTRGGCGGLVRRSLFIRRDQGGFFLEMSRTQLRVANISHKQAKASSAEEPRSNRHPILEESQHDTTHLLFCRLSLYAQTC
jgi:hypothetical protein